MKKHLPILVLLLALTAVLSGCGQTSVSSLRVGYARVDITPKESVPMGGYGDDRLSTYTKDPLYATCIAFTDQNDNTVLFIPLDLTRSYTEAFPQIRAYLSQKTGIPVDNIITTASHTHSGPNMAKTSDPRIARYNESIKELILQAAEAALEDRKPAEMYTTSTRATGLNFTRHYQLKNGTYAGVGYSFSSKDILRHIGVADDLMQMVKFTRKDGKNIILLNWQGHYLDNYGTYFTSDFFGVMRSTLEEELDCHFAYIAGAGGDTVSSSKISSLNTTSNYINHGKALSNVAIKAAQSFEKTQTGEVKVLKSVFPAPKKEATNYTLNITLYAFSIGDVAFACAPYEMFGTNGITIKENSDFKLTFIATQSNSHMYYIPALYGFSYDSYEAGVSRVAKGTAESLAEEFISMLHTLYAETGLIPT